MTIPDTDTARRISIHDLTRRSTKRRRFLMGIGIFQFTTSQGGRRFQKIKATMNGNFNSRPHKEVDQYSSISPASSLYFNSRPHKEVDVLPEVAPDIPTLFQFTTSQGGRPGLIRTV